MPAGTHRTPISILQEICVKKWITPVYELVSNGGPIHDPHYVFTCSAGDFSATSRGSSKKKTKHQASYLVLLKMLNSDFLREAEKDSLHDVHMAASNIFGTEFLQGIDDCEKVGSGSQQQPDEDSNYVGRMLELCQKNRWPPPSYEFSYTRPEPGQPPEYQCKVKLWTWEYTEIGTSKKNAKKKAACTLLFEILDNDLKIPPEALEQMEEDHLNIVSIHI
ncbi:unnamed protein product [Protopolystoma xenopodis]|uniref:DRBM domain-containing protein n=1 Tax=Protopolystoma xenopodis TaxID=117903 RepID=A0A448XLH5_9PLAT|nr:unnamed protein product [Protopolystoma xenopodis]